MLRTDHKYTGKVGNDTIDGTAQADIFNLGQGGHDHVNGEAGNDLFKFGTSFDPLDRVNGGTGNDTIELSGNYAGGVVLRATTMTSVETLKLDNGFDYSFTFKDANVAKGRKLSIDASGLDATHHLSINGAAETDGAYRMVGGAGDDSLTGGRGNDVFDLSLGGADTVRGGRGGDVFKFGAQFNGFDAINGGAGNDTLVLNGDYQTPITLQPNTLNSVEAMKFANGNNYNVVLDAGNLALGKALSVDASQLDSGHAAAVDATAVTQGIVNFTGGAGNDIFYGAANSGASDRIDMSKGGDDFVTLHNNATVYFGSAFTAADQVTNTLTGFGVVEINGDYSQGLTLGANTVTNLGGIVADPGHNYNLTLNDNTVAAGHYLVVAMSGHTATGNLVVDGSAETDGSFVFEGATGNDAFRGGALGDTIYVFSGRDTAIAGGGDDTIDAAVDNGLTAGDHFDGGNGNDTLTLLGNGGLNVALRNSTIQNIETFNLGIGDQTHAHIVLADGNVASGQAMTVNVYGTGASATIDGSAETNGTLSFVGSSSDGNDTFIGGLAGNNFTGGGGADKLVGAAGNDVFIYTAVSDSQGAQFDHVVGFDPVNDDFDVMSAVGAIDAKLVAGTVSKATFVGDMKAAIGSHLQAGDAMLFVAKHGDEAGKTFLVVDQNGKAGYQGGADLVLWLDGATHLNQLSAGDFH